MGREQGILPISANFEPNIAEPFDGRARVQLLSDLTDIATFGVYAYEGMDVNVYDDIEDNNGKYLLKALPYTNIANWEKLGSGGGSGGNSNINNLYLNNLVPNGYGYAGVSGWTRNSPGGTITLVDNTDFKSGKVFELWGNGTAENFINAHTEFTPNSSSVNIKFSYRLIRFGATNYSFKIRDSSDTEVYDFGDIPNDFTDIDIDLPTTINETYRIVFIGGGLSSGDTTTLSIGDIEILDNKTISKITPAIDSTTAFQITKADGITQVLGVDTDNNNVGIGGVVSASDRLYITNTTGNNTIKMRAGTPSSVSAESILLLEANSAVNNNLRQALISSAIGIADGDRATDLAFILRKTTGDFGDTFRMKSEGWFLLGSNGLTTNFPMVSGVRSRGTTAIPTTVGTGDFLLALTGNGHNGTEYTTVNPVAILLQAETPWTSTSTPTMITFGTTAVDSTSRVEAMRITSDRKVGIGTTTPIEALDVRGRLYIEHNTFDPVMLVNYGGGTTTGAGILGRKALGTKETPLSIAKDHVLTGIYGGGWDGNDWSGWRGAIRVRASEDWDINNHGTLIDFSTTANGSTSRSVRMTLSPEGNVGIGTTTPESSLVVVTNDTRNINFDRYEGSAGSAYVVCRKARGTQASPTAILNNDYIGVFGARGHTGTGFTTATGTYLLFQATENWAAGNNGASASIFTIPNGSTVGTRRLLINHNGQITAPIVYSTTVTSARDVQVDANGLLGYVSSTKESKNNIGYNLDSSWIYNLKPVSFKYRLQDEEGNYLEETDGIYREGLIAEDVNEVRPEMCYKDDDGTLRGVDYKYIISSLLNEVQKLRAELNEVKGT